MATSPPFRDVEFGSLLIYPATHRPPYSSAEQRAKNLLIGVKRDAVIPSLVPPGVIDWAIERLEEHLPGALERFFGDREFVLVPAPGAGLALKHSVSGPRSLCKALHRSGFCRNGVLEILERRKAVVKSAFAGPGQRPTLMDHYNSMGVVMKLDVPANIVIVDDIVTKGRTLLAGATRMREAFPKATVRVFALARTSPMDGDRFIDPVVGTIAYRWSDASRTP